MRISPFPYPYRSAFSFRADLDESVPEDYHRFAAARGALGPCSTHFVSTYAYTHHQSVLADLKRHDTQSHGHFHHVYREAELNRVNLERAHRILCSSGIEPVGFAAPHGRWRESLDEQLEDLGYLYSSDFQIGYDDFPFYPWRGDRFSRVLQIPVHPVCEGLFLDAGVDDPELIGEYFRQVIAARLDAGELAVIYGHPERRLGRMPEVMSGDRRGGRRPAAGLACVVFRAGAMVALARRAEVAGDPARGRSPGDPVRRMGHRVSLRTGHPARAVPVLGAGDGLADVARSERGWCTSGASRAGAGLEPAVIGVEAAFAQARSQGRDRLGDGDAAR